MNLMEDEDSMVSKVMAGVFVGTWFSVMSIIYWGIEPIGATVIGLVTAMMVFWLIVACSRPLMWHRDRLKYKLKYRLREQGIKCETHEEDLVLFENDTAICVRMKDSVCKRGAIRMAFAVFQGLDGRENVPNVGLSALANYCSMYAGPANTVFNGKEMVVMYAADIRTMHDFDVVREYAVSAIMQALRYLGDKYPEVYAHYTSEGQNRGESGSQMGFAIRHEEVQKDMKTVAEGQPDVQ